MSLQHIPADVADKVEKYLLMIQPDSEAATRGRYIGWVNALDYASVRKLMQDLQVGPYSNNGGENLASSATTGIKSPIALLVGLILAATLILLAIFHRKTP